MYSALIGMLIGDYILQTDWQAQNKTYKGRKWIGLLIALYHSLFVTASIYFCGLYINYIWSWQGLVILWLSHAIQDWLRLATLLMEKRKQFVHFKENMIQAYIVFSIVVDNVLHLALMFFLHNYFVTVL